MHDSVSVVLLCLPRRYIRPCLSASASAAALHVPCARSGCIFVLLAHASLFASASAAAAGASRNAEAEAGPETEEKVDAGAHTASVVPEKLRRVMVSPKFCVFPESRGGLCFFHKS